MELLRRGDLPISSTPGYDGAVSTTVCYLPLNTCKHFEREWPTMLYVRAASLMYLFSSIRASIQMLCLWPLDRFANHCWATTCVVFEYNGWSYNLFSQRRLRGVCRYTMYIHMFQIQMVNLKQPGNCSQMVSHYLTSLVKLEIYSGPYLNLLDLSPEWINQPDT